MVSKFNDYMFFGCGRPMSTAIARSSSAKHVDDEFWHKLATNLLYFTLRGRVQNV